MEKFNDEFLKGVIENAETSIDDKIKLILAEHEADKKGLLAKRDELLGTIAKNKEAIEAKEKEFAETSAKIAQLEEELKKKNPDDLKKLLENQFAEKENGYKKQIADLTEQYNKLKENDLQRLLNESIEEGLKDLSIMDGLRDGFIARVKTLYKFDAKEIDGKTRFLTEDMKEPKDVMHEFALSNEGKAYIKNPASGGGASGSYHGTQSTGASTMRRDQFEKLSPSEKAEFFKNKGTLI